MEAGGAARDELLAEFRRELDAESGERDGIVLIDAQLLFEPRREICARELGKAFDLREIRDGHDASEDRRIGRHAMSDRAITHCEIVFRFKAERSEEHTSELQ